jgi:hypothetical protein
LARSAVTAFADVVSVSGSVAMTVSPILTSSMALRVPSFIRTFVPGTKLLQSGVFNFLG